MAIRVKHDVSGRVSGDVAYATGKGQRAERDLRVAQQQAAERRRQALAENARQEALKQRQDEVEVQRVESQRSREFTADRDVYSRAGRVADLEFGRESTSIAGREAAEIQKSNALYEEKMRLLGYKKEIDIKQQAEIRRGNQSINDIKADESLEQWQKDDMIGQIKAKLRNVAVPNYVKPAPTALEDWQSRTQRTEDGVEFTIGADGLAHVSEVYKVRKEAMDAARETAAQEVKIKQEKANAEVTAKSDFLKSRNEMYLALIKADIEPEVAKTIVDERLPIPALTQEEMTAELNELIRIGGLEGKSPTEVIDSYAKATGGSQPQEQYPPSSENRHVLFDDLSKAEQEQGYGFLANRERYHREQEKPDIANLWGLSPFTELFAPQNKAQFREEYDANPKTRGKTGVNRLKEGVVPIDAKEVTDSQWKQMYSEYKRQENATSIESFKGFKELIRNNPEAIETYFIQGAETELPVQASTREKIRFAGDPKTNIHLNRLYNIGMGRK